MPDLRPDGDLAERSASAGPARFCSSRVCSACDAASARSTRDAVESTDRRSRRSGVLCAACTRSRAIVCAARIRPSSLFASGDGDESASGHAWHASDGQSALTGSRTDAFPGATTRSGAFPGADLQHRLPFRSRWPAAEAKSRPAADEHGPSRRWHDRTGMECRADGSHAGPFAASTQLGGYIASRRANARSSSRKPACRSARNVFALDSGGSFAAHAACWWHRCRPDARHDGPARWRIAAGT